MRIESDVYGNFFEDGHHILRPATDEEDWSTVFGFHGLMVVPVEQQATP